jgi:hypothetical protein
MQSAIARGPSVAVLAAHASVAIAQGTAAPSETAPRPTALNVRKFVINGGVSPAVDYDVNYEVLFEGDRALYRVGDGVRSHAGWLIASGGRVSNTMRLTPGQGTRTLYLEIRKDAVPLSSVRNAWSKA